MLKQSENNEVESEHAKYLILIDRYFDTRERVAFSVDVDVREYDEPPLFAVVAKISGKTLYQYESDNKEVVEALARKMGW